MKLRIVAALVCTLLLSGCWGIRDISELALVTGVGIDRTEEGQIRITVQIARPSAMAGGVGGGTAAGASAPVRVVSAEAPTIFEGIRFLGRSASRRIMWAHNQVIVIGRSQAEHGVKEIIDFFTRNPELRYRTLVVIAERDARSVLSETTGLEPIWAVSIDKSFRYAALLGVARRVDVMEFAAVAVDGDHSPVLPVVRLIPRLAPGTESPTNGPAEVEVMGMAVFRRERLAAVMDESASRGLLLTQGELGRAVVTIACPNQGNGAEKVTAEVARSSARVRITPVAARRARFDLMLSLNVDLTSLGCEIDPGNLRTRRELEARLTRLFEQDVRSLLVQIAETGTDPIGLGAHLRAKQSRLWASLNRDWPEAIRHAVIQPHVSVTIRGSNALLKSAVWQQGRNHE